MAEHRPAPPRWGQLQRYVFLEHRLFWEGWISRADLMDRFAISAPQASEDIANYLEKFPDSLEYDRSRKAYSPTSAFSPRYFKPNARQYLTQLLLVADEAIASEDSWLGLIPMHQAMPRLRRRLDVDTLRPVITAMHQRRAVEVVYQSMSTPDPTRRWIAPHALIYDGARWHARSWCFNRSSFVDFVLARFIAVGETRHAGIDPTLDREWQESFTVELAPNPSLTGPQRQVVEMDYGMEDGILRVPMRLCMTYYFERHFGLDLPSDLLPASRCQVVMQNRSELEQVRAIIGARTELSP
ncbi:MAG TPA: WYL domain-containing protein [Verrucomicrobiae bacterium]|nr:WYL domain-containing protein [Verrucomicrobiae bacterium]